MEARKVQFSKIPIDVDCLSVHVYMHLDRLATEANSLTLSHSDDAMLQFVGLPGTHTQRTPVPVHMSQPGLAC